MTEPIQLKKCLCVLADLRESLRNGGSAATLDYSCFGWAKAQSIPHLLSRRASFAELATLLGQGHVKYKIVGHKHTIITGQLPDITINNKHSFSQAHIGLYVLAWQHVFNLVPSLEDELEVSHRELENA